MTFSQVSLVCYADLLKLGLFSVGIRLISYLGSGGGASGRAMAFCPSEPGLNPGTDLAFFGNAINLF